MDLGLETHAVGDKEQKAFTVTDDRNHTAALFHAEDYNKST